MLTETEILLFKEIINSSVDKAVEKAVKKVFAESSELSKMNKALKEVRLMTAMILKENEQIINQEQVVESSSPKIPMLTRAKGEYKGPRMNSTPIDSTPKSLIESLSPEDQMKVRGTNTLKGDALPDIDVPVDFFIPKKRR